jgi:hypothetical protein
MARKNIKKIIGQLEKAIDHNLNVMMVGNQGIGKTEVVKTLFKNKGLKCKYFSCATLDPWVHVIGVPLPDKKTGTLDFFRTKDFEDAEVVFFDEFNRATRPVITNAVMEMIQFGTINGVKLPNLKMVWAAINPPNGNFHVSAVDPAVADRFHLIIQFEADPDAKYLSEKDQGKYNCGNIPQSTLEVIIRWWEELSPEQKVACSPRRIEDLGLLYTIGADLSNAVPLGETLPIAKLTQMLSSTSTDLIDRASINDPVKAPKILKAILEGNLDIEHQVVELVAENVPPDLFTYVSFVEAFSAESKAKFFRMIGKKLKLYIPNADGDFSCFQKDRPLIERFVALAKEMGIY